MRPSNLTLIFCLKFRNLLRAAHLGGVKNSYSIFYSDKYLAMVLKLGHFGQIDQKYLEVLKCGAGESWRSVGPIVWEMNKYYVEWRKKRTAYNKTKEDYLDWSHLAFRRLPSKTRYWRKDGTRRQGRRCKRLLDDLKETRIYWELKEEALDRTLWRTRFGSGYGLVVRQTAEWMKEHNHVTKW